MAAIAVALFVKRRLARGIRTFYPAVLVEDHIGIAGSPGMSYGNVAASRVPAASHRRTPCEAAEPIFTAIDGPQADAHGLRGPRSTGPSERCQLLPHGGGVYHDRAIDNMQL